MLFRLHQISSETKTRSGNTTPFADRTGCLKSRSIITFKGIVGRRISGAPLSNLEFRISILSDGRFGRLSALTEKYFLRWKSTKTCGRSLSGQEPAALSPQRRGAA